jgi:hypothetical protein
LEFGADFKNKLNSCSDYDDFVAKNKLFLKEIEDDKYVFAACNGWVMGPAI